MKNKKILIVDDDDYFVNSMCNLLKNNFTCLRAFNDKECFKKLSENPDLILQDVEINSEKDGIDIVKKVKEIHPNIPVIMLTKHKDYRIVKEAVLAGAVDYIVKPPDINELKNIISRAINEAALKEKFEVLKSEVKSLYGELVGNSEKMKIMKEKIKLAAEKSTNVLITGETGTGKELAARLIHELSDRKDEPFIPINISAIEKEMFLSEVFGHEKGAFTGASETKKGLFEIAGNGTIFLDEIGDMENNIQIKLLRMIEEKRIKRVGGIKDIEINARIIAATNQYLVEKIKKGSFRKDLFFRLNSFSIQMPALREITEDISTISDYFISKLTRRQVNFTCESLKVIKNYSWPGNVRELKSVLEMTLMHLKKPVIEPADIKPFLFDFDESRENQDIISSNLPYREAKDNFTKSYLVSLLKKNDYNITRVSEESGLKRPYIYRLMKRFGI